MSNKIDILKARLADVIAMSGERNELVEQRAGEWILYWFQHRQGAASLEKARPDVVDAIEAVAETLVEIPAPPFADAQQELSFYLGASVAVVRRLEDGQVKGGEWHEWANHLIDRAGSAARKLKLGAIAEGHRQGAAVANARFQEAKTFAVNYANREWEEWRESGGACPRIGEIAAEITTHLNAEPGQFALKRPIPEKTVRAWIKANCNAPDEASRPGAEKRR